jgi:hypothetical protein
VSFLGVLKIFFQSLYLVFFQVEISKWFRKAAFRCLALAIFVIIFLMSSGAYVISHLGDKIWFDLGAILWALLLFFFSGTLTAALMTFFLGLLGNETELLSALSGKSDIKMKSKGIHWRWSELVGAFISVLMSLMAAPFLIFPPLIPLGLLILSWGLGGEVLSCAERLLVQSSLINIEKPLKKPHWLRFSVGLGPAVMSLFPVLSWFLWPIALIVALRTLLLQQGIQKSINMDRL